jgi:hypothetical protein
MPNFENVKSAREAIQLCLTCGWTVRTLSLKNLPESRMIKCPDGALPPETEALRGSIQRDYNLHPIPILIAR